MTIGLAAGCGLVQPASSHELDATSALDSDRPQADRRRAPPQPRSPLRRCGNRDQRTPESTATAGTELRGNQPAATIDMPRPRPIPVVTDETTVWAAGRNLPFGRLIRRPTTSSDSSASEGRQHHAGTCRRWAVGDALGSRPPIPPRSTNGTDTPRRRNAPAVESRSSGTTCGWA